MTPNLLFVFFLFLQSTIATVAISASSSQQVTAAQYSDFLNHVPYADRYYHQALGTDPRVACIARINTSERFFYQVIAGREEDPVYCVTKLAKEAYAAFTGVKREMDEVEDGEDLFIASNQVDFKIKSGETGPLNLTLDSGSQYAYSQWSEGEKIAFWSLLALAAGAAGEHVRGRMVDSSRQSESSLLSAEGREQRNLKYKAEEYEIVVNRLQEETKEEEKELRIRIKQGGLKGAEHKATLLENQAEMDRLRREIEEHKQTAEQHGKNVASKTSQKEAEGSARIERFFAQHRATEKFINIISQSQRIRRSLEEKILAGYRSWFEVIKIVAEESWFSDAEKVVTQRKSAQGESKRDSKEKSKKGDLSSFQYPQLEELDVIITNINEALNELHDEHLAKVVLPQEAWKRKKIAHDLFGQPKGKEQDLDEDIADLMDDLKEPKNVEWNNFVQSAKRIFKNDKKQREEDVAAAEKEVKKEERDVKEAEKRANEGLVAHLLYDSEVKQEKQELEAAKKHLQEETEELSRLTQIETGAGQRHEALRPFFERELEELSASWEILHRAEENFIAGDFMVNVFQEDSGELRELHAQVLFKLSGLLHQAREQAGSSLANFREKKNLIEKKLDHTSSREVPKSKELDTQEDEKISAGSVIGETAQDLLNQAKKETEIILKERADEEKLKQAREQLQDIFNGLGGALDLPTSALSEG
ncbi:MAG: hypothetical protein ACH346_05175 [Chthoniobacterales bacterium]